MKYLNLMRIKCIICVAIMVMSCQIDEDVNPVNETHETGATDLAIFNFSNGLSLTLSQEFEASDFVVTALEGGVNGNELFFDFDNNSMLDVYLALTPENYPVPRALIVFADPIEKARISNKRQIVEKPDSPVRLKIDKIPAELLEKNGNDRLARSQSFCDDRSSVDHCANSTWSHIHYWYSNNKYWRIQNYTSVFSTSEYGAIVYGQYKTTFGGWRNNNGTIYEVFPGHWKRKTFLGGKRRWRRSRRVPRAEFGGVDNNPSHKVTWKGYTDFW